MKKLWVGLLSGLGLALLWRGIHGCRASLAFPQFGHHGRDNDMNASEKFVASAREALAANPGASTPGHEFLRDWAYGNARLEDERITLDQVEDVMSKKSA